MKKLYLFYRENFFTSKLEKALELLKKEENLSYEILHDKSELKKLNHDTLGLILSLKDYKDFYKQDLLEFIENKKNKCLLLVENSDINTLLEALSFRFFDIMSPKKKTSEIFLQIQSFIHSQKTKYDSKQSLSLLLPGKTLSENFLKLKKIASSEVRCVLVTGESGTGKELMADFLETILESQKPFIRINCASLSNELVESELFGHKKGSFTGAHTDSEGLLKTAQNGWVFFDEIACLPARAQSSLLRFLENGEIRSVGDYKSQILNVRILSATNEPLEKMVEEKKFRRDLLERLKGYEIKLPPFRKRSENEKKEILNYLIQKENTLRGSWITEELKKILMFYSWKKGNIRELKNCLSNLNLNKKGRIAKISDLPHSLIKNLLKEEKDSSLKLIKSPKDELKLLKKNWLLEKIEKLKKINGKRKLNKTMLSEFLDISPWKLEKLIKETGELSTIPHELKKLLPHEQNELSHSFEEKSATKSN